MPHLPVRMTLEVYRTRRKRLACSLCHKRDGHNRKTCLRRRMARSFERTIRRGLKEFLERRFS